MNDPNGVRLVGGTLIDPSNRTAQLEALTFTGDQISESGTGGVSLDATGLFVVPGLIDMHVHLVPTRYGGTRMSDDLFGAAASSLSTALTAGVTTVRDLGGPLEILTALKEAQEVGDIAASRVIAAGPALSAPGGHGLDSGHGAAIATPVAARNMVAALARTPTQWIKVVTSGARGHVQMPRETFEAVMAQAHDSGIPVAAHAHFQGDQLRTAVQLGVRTVEHGFLLHQQPHLAEQMANAGTFLCATTRVVESIREDPNWYGQKLIPGAWDDVRASTALAFKEGVQVVAGTDAGVFGANFGEVWREVELLKETTEPWAALAAATSTAAAALGRRDLGNLLPGSKADVVVVRRDPLSSEVTADDVVAVFQGGQLVSGTLNPVPHTRSLGD